MNRELIFKSNINLVKEIVDKQYDDAKKEENTNKDWSAGYLCAMEQCKKLIDALAEIAKQEERKMEIKIIKIWNGKEYEDAKYLRYDWLFLENHIDGDDLDKVEEFDNEVGKKYNFITAQNGETWLVLKTAEALFMFANENILDDNDSAWNEKVENENGYFYQLSKYVRS